MEKYKTVRTDALVAMLCEITRELEHGRALNQIQLEILAAAKSAAQALNLSVNG